MIKKFYVYSLKDPLTDEVFYIGKGSKKRALSHLNESEWKYNKRKGEKIKEILELGMKPKIEILFETDNKDAAYDYEEMKIKELGRKNIDENGILLNLSESSRPPKRTGKPGTFLNKFHSQKTKEKISKKLKEYFSNTENRKKLSEKIKSVSFKNRKTTKGYPATKPQKYIVEKINGEKFEIINLDKWCKKNGFSTSTLRDTLPQRKNRFVLYGPAKGYRIYVSKKQ